MTPARDLSITLTQLYISLIPFAFVAVVSGAGLYYGVWEVSPPSPDDAYFASQVRGFVGGVFGMVEGLIEDVGER